MRLVYLLNMLSSLNKDIIIIIIIILSRMFAQRPNFIKYESLMNTNNKRLLVSKAKCIKVN